MSLWTFHEETGQRTSLAEDSNYSVIDWNSHVVGELRYSISLPEQSINKLKLCYKSKGTIFKSIICKCVLMLLKVYQSAIKHFQMKDVKICIEIVNENENIN